MRSLAQPILKFVGLLSLTCLFAFGTAGLVRAADGDLSRVLPLLRTDGSSVGTSAGKLLPKGRVSLTIKDGKQSFAMEADNLAGPYDKGLSVFWGDSPDISDTNAVLHYVAVMSQVNSSNQWRLAFDSSPWAPAQLGITNLTDLVGKTIFVASETNQAVLRAA